MHNKKSLVGKIISFVLAAVMICSAMAVNSFAADTLEAGTYDVDATLSCYVNAMGGVEFSDGYGLLKSSSVVVADDGSADITLNLGTTSGLSIYSVACTAFIGTDETPGYYANGSVTKEGVTYTVSSETVANANGEVNYIDSITLPVEQTTSEYTLWIYLDSNVMGCQLGDGSGTGASNNPGVATAHTAVLTIDWSSASSSDDEGDEEAATPDESSSQTANVEYTIEGGYEVEIPATITVDANTKKGTYDVVAKNFVIAESAYVTVTATESGVLSNGTSTVNLTNTLADGKLKATGDTLAGTVEVTSDATTPGTYTGTVNFVINYYAD